MRRPLLLVLALALLAGCENPQNTVDDLRMEIAAFKAAPSQSAQTKIEVDFTKLESQIERLEDKGKVTEARAYRVSAANLRSDYRAACMVNALKDAQSAVEGLGHAFKEAGSSIGDALRGTATPTQTPN